MTTSSSPQPLTDLARQFVGIGFSPMLLEQMTTSMMRLIEAQFALAQSIAQAQFGVIDALMRAGNQAEAGAPTHRTQAHPIITPHLGVKRPERAAL